MNVLHFLNVINNFFSIYGEKKALEIIQTLNSLSQSDNKNFIEFYQAIVANIANVSYNEVINNVHIKHCLFYFLHKKLKIPLKTLATHYNMTKRGVAYAVANFDKLLSACSENNFIYENHKNIVTIYYKLLSFFEYLNDEQNVN